jgi:ABC-type lipoprotein release transport system permease subunit
VSLALLAVATLSHVLLTSVRRRRRDLAMLKTLGLLRPQVLSMVLWQACALTAAALLAGLPLGIVAGRWSWAIFAGSLGVATDPTVPAPALLAIIPAALTLASLIAAGPGWRAAQTRPAAILRNE